MHKIYLNSDNKVLKHNLITRVVAAAEGNATTLLAGTPLPTGNDGAFSRATLFEGNAG